MKLIIDIDEDVYKLFTSNGQGMKVVKFNLENALKNGTPLEEELKKIKDKILEHHSIKCYGTCETYCPYSDCIESKDVIEDLQIIDKHIAELKGE